jgi:hypothetical protein
MTLMGLCRQINLNQGGRNFVRIQFCRRAFVALTGVVKSVFLFPGPSAMLLVLSRDIDPRPIAPQKSSQNWISNLENNP